jgi:hypothetical protein
MILSPFLIFILISGPQIKLITPIKKYYELPDLCRGLACMALKEISQKIRFFYIVMQITPILK